MSILNKLDEKKEHQMCIPEEYETGSTGPDDFKLVMFAIKSIIINTVQDKWG